MDERTFGATAADMQKLSQDYDFCVPGNLVQVFTKDPFQKYLSCVRVFARVSPEQKVHE